MKKKWIWTPPSEEEVSLGVSLSEDLKIPPIMGQLLVQRGIKTPKEANTFFYPKLKDLHNPFLMKDMEKAVERLNKAVGRKEKILIYGDYDVDGTTAVSLVYNFLSSIGCSEQTLDYYIPGRNEDGYGITFQGVDYAKEINAQLVIVLDCGIKAVEEVKYAQSIGIDFIICDHHTPAEELPNAVAILNPKREDNTYPQEDLSGCGIGFKFMQAFTISNNLHPRYLYSQLDLVAVSIASDVVSVLGENRILAHFGLKKLNKEPSMGLRALIKKSASTAGVLSMSDIVYRIGPMLNASGRLFNGERTVELLISKSYKEAEQHCNTIYKCNKDRRKLDQIATKEAFALVKEEQLDKKGKALIIYKKDWHKGVIGIVATRLAEKYALPTIILCGEDDMVVGSARSAGGVDIYAAIDSCNHLLTNFGGHPFAVGMALTEQNLDEFKECVQKYLEKESSYSQPNEQKIFINAQLSLNEINHHLYCKLQQMGPFGPGNEEPIFMSRFLFDSGKSSLVGARNSHIKLELTDSPHKQEICEAIAYDQVAHYDYIKSLRPFSVCYSIEGNSFKSPPVVQLLVKDIKTEDISRK